MATGTAFVLSCEKTSGALFMVKFRNPISTFRVCFPLLLSAGLCLAPAAYAESWWSKGVDILTGSSAEQSPESEADQPSVESLVKSLSNEDLTDAFRQALELGASAVVDRLGVVDGFYADEQVRVPLPDTMLKVRSVLDRIGMASLADDLETKLNRAAEAAVPKTRQLFVDAIKSLSFEDIRRIYEGPEDSATQYFRSRMSDDLQAEMKPIVDQALSEVGAIQAYDQLLGNYKSIPFVPDIGADLSTHVLDKGLDGIFLYLAKEEAAIRQDPVKQSTELLRRVFGI